MRSSALGAGLVLNKSMNNSSIATGRKAENESGGTGVNAEVESRFPLDWFHFV